VAPGGTLQDGTSRLSRNGETIHHMDGQLSLDELVSSRRPLDTASASLDDLQAGLALRTLLIP
jgi:Zn-dependent alcohol dehydrogenase